MTEPKEFDWIIDWLYETSNGREVRCLYAWDNGEACVCDFELDLAYLVDKHGKAIRINANRDIIEGPEPPDGLMEEVNKLEQEHEEYLAEGAQLEKDVKVEMDCYKEGHRQGLLDALAAILAQRDRLSSCELMEVIGEIASLGPYDSAAPF
jgi:hypothetical protein